MRSFLVVKSLKAQQRVELRVVKSLAGSYIKTLSADSESTFFFREVGTTALTFFLDVFYTRMCTSILTRNARGVVAYGYCLGSHFFLFLWF